MTTVSLRISDFLLIESGGFFFNVLIFKLETYFSSALIYI